MSSLATTAQEIAYTAGQFILEARKHPETITVYEKAPLDLVTTIDQAVDRLVVEQIRLHYPHHSILSEEGGLIAGDDTLWIIDPIDGTTNFARGIPHFAISIAVKRQQLLAGAIFDPIRNEMFTAERGAGAYLNGQRIHVSNHTSVDHSLIATGFPSKRQQLFSGFVDCLHVIFPEALGIRRGGAATLDLAYIAAGRLDGYFEFDVREWDIAAGQLIIEEAGGSLCDLAGGTQFPELGIIAGTPALCQELVKRFSSTWEEQLYALFMQINRDSMSTVSTP